MLHIYLDTALLAVPNYGTDAATVQELIDRVTHFSIIQIGGLPLLIVVADDAEDALGIEYPNFQSISEFLDIVGLTHEYSVKDLLKQYQSILDRGARPGAIGCFEVCVTSAFAAKPPLPPGLGPIGLVAESERIFTSVAAQGVETAWWVGSAMNGTAGRQFEISSTVINATADPSPVDGPLPFTFTRHTKTLENIEDLVSFSAAKQLWRNSDTAEDLHLAISLGALALLRGADPNAAVGSLKQFSIGSGFLESLDSHNCAKAQKYSATTFELCTQIVADNGVASVNPMGRPHQTVRTIDQATAWRAHVTGGGLALRLMHWRTSTDIEFANVGVKKALYIDPGNTNVTKLKLNDLV